MRGDSIEEMGENVEIVRGDTLLLLLNAHHGPRAPPLPDLRPHQVWVPLVDTAND